VQNTTAGVGVRVGVFARARLQGWACGHVLTVLDHLHVRTRYDCKHEIVAIGCMAQVVKRAIRGKRTRENGCDVRCDAALRVAGWSLASANHLLACKRAAKVGDFSFSWT
jgi:hypothetical protein